MTEGTPPDITTKTNTNDTSKLNPDSSEPWSSNPDETDEPVITVTLPNEETITEVTLLNTDNVKSYEVVVTDDEGNSETVSHYYIQYICNFSLVM